MFTEVGLKTLLAPLGNPLALKATSPVKPPIGVIVTVEFALPPAGIDTEAGVAATEKFLPATRVALALWLRFPKVAVTVNAYVPGGVDAEVQSVSVDELEPLIELGLKLKEVIGGCPLRPNRTVPLNPFWAAMVTVYVAQPPRPTDCELGVTDNVKF